MSPERKQTIRGYSVKEYYWAGRYPCYVDNRLSAEDFDKTVERLRRGEEPLFV